MNIYRNYIAPFLQGFNTSQLALFVAILSMVFVVTLKDGTRCLSAQCVAGANEVMAGDITVKSGNPNGTTLKSTSTSDIDINLPGTAGTLLHSASTLGNDQFLQTNATGGIITGDIPALDIDDSTKVDTTGGTQGQILKVASAGGLEFANYEINETQFDSSNASTLGQFLRSNASNSLDFDTLELDDISLIGSPAQGDQVRVNANGELETFTASATVINESTFDSANGTLNQYLRVNGSSSLSYDTLELDDISLIGSPAQGDQVRVNASGELETYTPAGGGGQWTLKASGQSQQATAGMISGDSNTHQVVLCWGGTNSTDGVDGNYFRMTKGKQYKLVLSTKANLNGYYNSSTSYNNIGTAWIGNGVDCSNGTVPTNSPTAGGYNYMIDNYFLHPSGEGTNYYGTQAYYCNLFAGQTVQSNNMPESWHGEIILNDFQTYFGSVRNGVTAVHDIRFAGNDVSQSPYIGYGGHSTGTCEAYTSTPGGYISDVNDIYGLYFRNIRPSSWNSNAQSSLLYWLYESNDYDNSP